MLSQLILLILNKIINGQQQCECTNFMAAQQCESFSSCSWNGKICYQPDCNNIVQETKCQAPSCAWYLDKCHDGQQCNFYTDKQLCNQVFGCVANDGYCLPYEDCSYSTKSQCVGLTPSGIQCFWNPNSQACIKYQSCNRMSLDNNDCNSIPYCIQMKNQCVNFNDLKCEDMTTQFQCQRMAPYQCSWYEGECIYYPCTKYQSQSSCTLNQCTWNGNQCLYCPETISSGYVLEIIILAIVLIV